MKLLLFSITAAIILTGCSISNEEKLIQEYLNENLNDIKSYSSVSFSPIDSLKTEWKLPKSLESDYIQLETLAKELNRSGYNNITVTSDASYHIKDLEKFSEPKYQNIYSGKEKEDFFNKVNNWKSIWVEFKHYQDIIYKSKNSFVSEFKGWKVIHKFRAKNLNGAMQLNEYEFWFNRDKTKIIGAKKIK